MQRGLHMKKNIKSTQSKSKTDWNRLKKMTNKEIEEAAKSDPDLPLYSMRQLKSMKFKHVGK